MKRLRATNLALQRNWRPLYLKREFSSVKWNVIPWAEFTSEGSSYNEKTPRDDDCIIFIFISNKHNDKQNFHVHIDSYRIEHWRYVTIHYGYIIILHIFIFNVNIRYFRESSTYVVSKLTINMAKKLSIYWLIHLLWICITYCLKFSIRSNRINKWMKISQHNVMMRELFLW